MSEVTDRDILGWIDKIPILRALDAGDRAAIAAIAHIQRATAGSILFRQGDPSDTVLLVAEGRVLLSVRYAGRPDVMLLSLGPGELAGWSGLLSGRSRVATAKVTEDAVLLVLPADALRELCERDHDIGYAIHKIALREVAERLHDTRLQLLDLYAKQDER